jgi:hypothetical protein
MMKRPRLTLERALVAVSSLFTPLLGGQVLYYALRKTHPKAADFANSMSALGLLVWAFLVPWRWASGDGRVVVSVLAVLGAMATDLAIRLIRQSEPEGEPPEVIDGASPSVRRPERHQADSTSVSGANARS